MAKTFVHYDKKDSSSNLVRFICSIIGNTFLSCTGDGGSSPSSSTNK